MYSISIFFSFSFFFFLSFLQSSKILFFSFQLFVNGHIYNVVLTLINVVKLKVESSNIVSTLSNVVNINNEIDNVVLTFLNVVSTLFNVVNFQVGIHNVVSMLIWQCPTSRRRNLTTTTLNQRWNVCWQ